MDLRNEVAQLRHTGAEKATVLWEMLENLPEPIDPVNIFKASCSIKCAEFMTRMRTNALFATVTRLLAVFMDDTLTIAGDNVGDRTEGFRVIDLLEREMPLTREVFEDPAAYATRQHVYDALIILAAAKMGKAEETKEAIERLQKGVARAMVTALFSASMLEAANENPEDDNE